MYEHLAACTCVCMRVYMCVYLHACMYILLYPTPQVLKLASLASTPPPRPPPKKKKKKNEKLPTPMTTLLTYAGRDLFFLSYQIKAINRWFTSVCLSVCTPGQCSSSFVCCPIYQILHKTRFKLHLNQHNLAASVQNAKVLTQALNVHIGFRLHLGMTNGFCTCL